MPMITLSVAIANTKDFLNQARSWDVVKSLFLEPWFPELDPLEFKQCGANGCIMYRDEHSHHDICPRCGSDWQRSIYYMPISFILQLMMSSSKMAAFIRQEFKEMDELVNRTNERRGRRE